MTSRFHRSWSVPVLLAGTFSSCADKAAPVEAMKPVAQTASVRRTGKVSIMGLSAFTLLQQRDKVRVYDVRPGFVYAFGHLPGAVNWPRQAFRHDLPRHEPDLESAKTAGKVTVLYCTDTACPDAEAVAVLLSARGHDVSVLEGGYAAWKDAGLPTE